jgi:hypothetical protein
MLFTLGTLFFSTIKATAQPGKLFIDTSVDILGDYKMTFIGYPEGSPVESTVEADSVLKIVRISKSAFLALSKNYSPTIKYDTSTIIRTKKTFTIKNGHFKRTFATNQICECISSTYEGIIAPLNLYVVYSGDMENEVSNTEFIDYRTGKSFDVPCDADAGPQDILLSPQQKTLLTYSSSDFEEGYCSIYLLKIKKSANGQRYTMKTGLMINFDRMNIEKLVWVNEKCFAMEVIEGEEIEYNNDHRYGKKKKYFMKVNLR